MAKPPSSSSKKDRIVCADLDEEESGWTSYFEDLSTNTNCSCFSFCGGCDGSSSSSLVSDAASFAACKFSSNNNYALPKNLPDLKLRFKKSQQANYHQISEDDPLEDTATSPLNSPKDGDLNPTEMISRKTGDDRDLLYAASTGKGLTELGGDDDEEDKNNSKGEKNMKKRGLSLFHLSLLVNYFG